MATGFTGIFNTGYVPVPLSITGYAGPTGGNWMEWTVHANTIKAVGPTGATDFFPTFLSFFSNYFFFHFFLSFFLSTLVQFVFSVESSFYL